MFDVTDNKGVRITLANGYSVSIQWGKGNYCNNRNNPDIDYTGPVPASNTAETAIIDPDGNFVDYNGDGVQGYQTPADVIAALNWASTL